MKHAHPFRLVVTMNWTFSLYSTQKSKFSGKFAKHMVLLDKLTPHELTLETMVFR